MLKNMKGTLENKDNPQSIRQKPSREAPKSTNCSEGTPTLSLKDEIKISLKPLVK